MEIAGYCKRCKGPIFWNLEVDNNGYKVRSLRCWNGHYKVLVVLNLAQVANHNAQKVKFIPYKCPKCGGDFNFIQRIPPVNEEPIPVNGTCRTCGKEYKITLYRNSSLESSSRKGRRVRPEGSLKKRQNGQCP